MLTTKSALSKDRRTGLSPMQHRHFATIATIIRNYGFDGSPGRTILANHFADELAGTNPNFDRGRFLRASGVEG